VILVGNGGDGFILIFDITDSLSFDHLSKIREQITKIKDVTKFPQVLVGNKKDLDNERSITKSQAENFASTIGGPYLEASAKNYENIENVFVNIVREIRKFKRS